MTPTSDPEPQPGQLRVLHVEDNEPDAELVAQALRKGGLSISVVVVQEEAAFVRELRAHRPEVVIADYNLPGDLTGAEVVARLREALRCDIPAIILTGDISSDTLRKTADADCVHLSKPAEPETLTRQILAFLAMKQQPKSADAPRSNRSSPSGHT